MQTIKQVLMTRDRMTEIEADELISDARAEMYEVIEEGGCPNDVCYDFFGLEPDYIMELI